LTPLDFVGASFFTLGLLVLAMSGSSSESDWGFVRFFGFDGLAFFARGMSSSESSLTGLVGVDVALDFDFAFAARGRSSSESDSFLVTLGFLDG
jgi:hypothetical protein